MKRLVINPEDVEEALLEHLDDYKELTEEVYDKFVNYLEIDLPQWLTDNAKSFMTNVMNEPETYYRCEDCGTLTPYNEMVKWQHDDETIERICKECAERLGVKPE